jgi:hypothetical protein
LNSIRECRDEIRIKENDDANKYLAKIKLNMDFDELDLKKIRNGLTVPDEVTARQLIQDIRHKIDIKKEMERKRIENKKQADRRAAIFKIKK